MGRLKNKYMNIVFNLLLTLLFTSLYNTSKTVFAIKVELKLHKKGLNSLLHTQSTVETVPLFKSIGLSRLSNLFNLYLNYCLQQARKYFLNNL